MPVLLTNGRRTAANKEDDPWKKRGDRGEGHTAHSGATGMGIIIKLRVVVDKLCVGVFCQFAVTYVETLNSKARLPIPRFIVCAAHCRPLGWKDGTERGSTAHSTYVILIINVQRSPDLEPNFRSIVIIQHCTVTPRGIGAPVPFRAVAARHCYSINCKAELTKFGSLIGSWLRILNLSYKLFPRPWLHCNLKHVCLSTVQPAWWITG